MSLITRCPKCATLFKVEPDQLLMAQGWVRCGQCDHVFDGSVLVVSVPTLTSVLKVDALPEMPRVDLEGLLRRKDVEPVSAPAVVELPSTSLPSPTAEPMADTLLRAEHEMPSQVELAGTSRLATAWRKWSCRSRPAQILLTLVLVLGLLVQMLIQARHELVARMPAWAPVMSALCMPFQCTLTPLRRLDGIVIDSSSFARGDTGFILNLTLRNSAEVPLSMTSMELTLTDAQDRAVIRRVLSPSDMRAPHVLRPGEVWETALSVEPVYASTDVAGYRLVSFYP